MHYALLIHALEASRFTLELLLVALYGCGGLAFAGCRGLLIGFATPRLGEDASFLAGALKAPQSDIKWFVFPYLDGWHCVS